MAKSERLEVRLDAELLERLDRARGREPRASFVRWALEQALAGGEAGGPSAAVRPRGGRSVGLASARASVPDEGPFGYVEWSPGGGVVARDLGEVVGEVAPAELPRIARRHWAQ